MDAVEHLPQEPGAGGGTDPEQGGHLEAQVLRDRGCAMSAVPGKPFGRLAERLVHAVECPAKPMNDLELLRLRGDDLLVHIVQLSEQILGMGGHHDGRRLGDGGYGDEYPHAFDYTP